MGKEYEPSNIEARWARWWVETGMYKANASAPSPRFSIVIPPPSVNGSLHMGHMLEHSIIDATVRWRRMRGDNTLWLPGTDHAGHATQLLVERVLSSEGTSRTQIGRQNFENRMWQWTERYNKRIADQMKHIGNSVDWSREKFTLAPDLSQSVNEAFVRLYDRGLIYRDISTVNWCPQCQTVISDAEVFQEVTEGRCDRCKCSIKSLASKQWFIRTGALAGKALAAVSGGDIRFVPEHWSDSLVQWMKNAGDWCISRQLWWGHRIPAWHCQNCRRATVARTTPVACSHCGEGRLEQDSDVLDTWFSAGLWPFATLGWPEETEDLTAYYPTSLLITGCEIVFLWVARMIMLGLELTGQPPFRVVHIHGLVRDANGNKMSKTTGNVIDPISITSRFGTDAVRMSLSRGVVAGSDIIFSEEDLKAAQNFTQKVWNTASLLFADMETCGVIPAVLEPGLLEALEDRWIFSRLQKTIEVVNRSLESYCYHEMSASLAQFFGHDLCDCYFDIKRPRIIGRTGLTNDWRNVLAVFAAALRLLHPLMPFITEELWHRLGREDSISLQSYPTGFPVDEDAEQEMSSLFLSQEHTNPSFRAAPRVAGAAH